MKQMKKWFDKFVAQSTKGQVLALAVAFLVLVLIGGVVGRSVAGSDNDDNLASFGRPETWGFMQCVDGGFVQATIGNNTEMEGGKVKTPAPMPVILLSLGFWFCGMVLVSFFTGAATDFLNSRREKILAGGVDYVFRKNYILIVGFDFQVKNLVKMLLTENPKCDIALITDTPTENILDDLSSVEARRLFMMRKDIADKRTYDDFTITGATEIYLMGDADAVGRDGKTLQALERMSEKAKRESGRSGAADFRRVKVYMHIEDSVLYSQLRAVQLSADSGVAGSKTPIFDLEVFNYYESWAWKCWSQKDSDDGTRDGSAEENDQYLPIRHVGGSRDVYLFVIGAGRMGRAMVNFAMPLMNYGEDGKHCHITVFDTDPLKKGFFADREILDALPETEVRFEELDGCSDAANAIMLGAAEKSASVTVVIALSDPGEAIRAYSELSNRLRRKNISVLVWQATDSGNCPCKRYLKMGGPGTEKDPNLADAVQVRYFGMTDLLPWKNPARFNYGMAVNYFYNCWFPYGKEFPESPKYADSDFVAKARKMWQVDENGLVTSTCGDVCAVDDWAKTPRWKKWASVNSGDAFKEKSSIFRAGLPYAEAASIALKAEHNRWWTEKLLGGWIPDANRNQGDESHADKSNMIHGDMVPFERLSEGVKDKDKINIAAMAACGFIE